MNLLYKYKISIIVLAFGFLAVTSGEYFHHHDDSNFDESNCPVCIIIHSLSNINISSSPEIVHPTNFIYISIVDDISKPELAHTLVLSDRAPPTTHKNNFKIIQFHISVDIRTKYPCYIQLTIY